MFWLNSANVHGREGGGEEHRRIGHKVSGVITQSTANESKVLVIISAEEAQVLV